MTEEKPKRHRRSNAEVAAEKAMKAAAKEAKLAGTTVPVSAAPVIPTTQDKPKIPEANGEFMTHSIIEVFSFLAKSKVHPCMYTDAFDLMRNCLDFKKQFNLTDERFLELMHAFEDVEKGKKR